MSKVKVDNIDLYYEICGEGDELVLISGFAGSIDIWFRQIPELSQSYRVIAFDNRGCGRSDKPDVPYTMKLFAQDTAALLDNLKIDKAHIFGISMGGMIAQEFALSYPDRLISLVLGCTSCGGRHFILPDDETIDFLLNIKHVDSLTPEERARAALPYSFSQEFIRNRPDIIEQYISMRVEFWPPTHSFLRQAEAVVTHNTYDRLPRIVAPTLVISGSADRQVPVENAKILASNIPNAELFILDNMGHGFIVEAAEQTNKAIINFLKRQSRTPLRELNRPPGKLQTLRFG